MYVSEGSLEAALTLFTRFSTMWIEALPRHPDFASSDGAAEKAKTQGYAYFAKAGPTTFR